MATDATRAEELFKPGSIGGLELRNRLIRAGTSESMAGDAGEITDELTALYERLARNELGGIFTGHLYCDPRGQYATNQTGIYDDRLIPGLTQFAAKVGRHGARLFAQLAHAGSQSRVPGVEPVAPSSVPNVLTGRPVPEASAAEIEATVAAFGAAAVRAVEAGFDGIHIHGANGYLISEFSSPLTNLRDDEWGGSPERRDRFAVEVVRAVRAAAPPEMPVTLKLGMYDAQSGGLQVEESVDRAERLVVAGLDAIEVSVNAMLSPTDSANTYVAVDRKRAASDFLVHRLFSDARPEAYYRPLAEALRERGVDCKVVLVGGLRTTQTMNEVLASGDADFLSMARPLIREPDLVRQLSEGRTGRVDCTSCNLCLTHEGHHTLRCWRKPRRRLLRHAAYRLSGGFRREPISPKKH